MSSSSAVFVGWGRSDSSFAWAVGAALLAARRGVVSSVAEIFGLLCAMFLLRTQS